MAIHSSILAWEIPWLEKPGGLQSVGPQSLTRLSDFFSPWSFGALPEGCASAPRPEGAFREPAALAARAPEAERTRYLLSLEIELAVLGRESETTLRGITAATFPSQVMAPARGGQHSFTLLYQRDAVRL